MGLDAWLFGIASLVVGAVGSWLISLHFFKKAKTWREISWLYSDRLAASIQDGFADRFKILFDDNEVAEPYIFELHIWNSGTETIHKKDIADASPISIDCGESTIIDYTISRVVNGANNITLLANSDTQLTVGFDYLDPDEGLVVQIIADAPPEADIAVRLSGTVIGKGRIHSPKVRIGDRKRDLRGLAAYIPL